MSTLPPAAPELPSVPEDCSTPQYKDFGTIPSTTAETRACTRSAAVLDSPRIVTTGGNLATPGTDVAILDTQAHIDWFACTLPTRDKSTYDHEQMMFMAELLRFLAISEAQIIEIDKGWFGYTTMANIVSPDRQVNYGLLAYGGESQKGSIHIELNAQGCATVTCWEEIAEWGNAHHAVITRLDLAHDDFTGNEITVGVALDWYKQGRFNQNGRPPKAKLIDDLGSGEGKTLYIGSRKSGKLLRVYEKGKHLGDPTSPWTRVEAELRNKSRIIPWKALTQPGAYLAGTFPCLAFLSDKQEKIRTIAKAGKITLTAATHHLQKSGGKLVDVLMKLHHEDAQAVVEKIRGEGIPRRLMNYAAYLPETLSEEGP